jgi:hypothetical protein
MKKTNLLAILALAATPAFLHAQTTSYSDVVGYYKKSFPTGGSLHSVALLKPVTFQGTATSISSAVLTCNGANWSANAFVPVNGLPTYYVEITSGPREGYLYDIVSNTANTVTVDDASLSDAGTTPTFIVRAHSKLSEVLGPSVALSDYQDQATIYNPDGSYSNFLRDSSIPTGWLDATLFSESDAVIYPNQGYILTTATAGDYTVTGTLKATKTAVPLFPNVPNIVSLANPGGVSRDIQAISLGANMLDFQDQVAKYNNDGSLTLNVNLLYSGSAEGFYDATTFSAATGVTVEGGESVIATVVSPTVWIVNPPLSQ